MRALFREPDEIIPETDLTQWMKDHIKWMTTPRPNGDGYQWIEDYQPPEDEDDQ